MTEQKNDLLTMALFHGADAPVALIKHMPPLSSRVVLLNEAKEPDVFVQQCQLHRPKLAVLAVEEVDSTICHLIRQLQATSPDVPVLCLATEVSSNACLNALYAGAGGYVQASSIPLSLPSAVELVALGGLCVSPSTIWAEVERALFGFTTTPSA